MEWPEINTCWPAKLLFLWQESSYLCLLPAQLPQTVRHLFKNKDLQGQKSSKYFRHRYILMPRQSAVGVFHISVRPILNFKKLQTLPSESYPGSCTVNLKYLLNKSEELICILQSQWIASTPDVTNYLMSWLQLPEQIFKMGSHPCGVSSQVLLLDYIKQSQTNSTGHGVPSKL